MSRTARKPVEPPLERQKTAEAQLKRLRDCLEEKSWSVNRAVIVLAGFVPNELGILGRDSLPGSASWRGMSEPEIEESYNDLIRAVAQFVWGDRRRPAEWLRMALDNGYAPPWFSVAVADKFCAEFLPEEVRLPSQGMKQSQIRKGLARRRADPVWYAIEKHGKELFQDWWNEEIHARITKPKLAENISDKVLSSGDINTRKMRYRAGVNSSCKRPYSKLDT